MRRRTFLATLFALPLVPADAWKAFRPTHPNDFVPIPRLDFANMKVLHIGVGNHFGYDRSLAASYGWDPEDCFDWPVKFQRRVPQP